ncbi:beta-ketoacyl synthase family protein [Hoeflea sp. IMCC20628]|uniref:beta-ketoacyl synthase N-terminal-like domain-containing protein n=1 Tax=Hoeflea sp. IMCC20628 TaxID=1620421 RepID=UPI00063AFE9E|nr:beta-ketoacyl synthase N-terminal-like domain-containing protein [Hoeflea sp. IMCC20628]AKI01945.1 beta-ketoacyl synthase family protein [Hoeflea sp. IMCC20628]
MNRTVVITAANTLTQSGADTGCIAPDAAICTKTRTIPESLVDADCPIGQRLKRKVDGFCRKGLAVANRAIAESMLLESDTDPDRIGIYVGNCLGGWGHIDAEIRALHQVGVSAIGPYVATAWFPAALQGQISLHYGFRGHSKTFSAFDVAGVQALAYAAQAIRLGVVDAVVCCASEDLSSVYVRRVLEETVARGWPASPVFEQKRAGSGVESAVAFVLENREMAIARGAPILCELAGCHDGFINVRSQIGPMLHACMEKLVESKSDPLLCILDGRFSCEHSATASTLQDRCIDGRMIDVSAILGEQFSVGGLMETAIAARALYKDRLSPATFGQSGENLFRQAIIQRLSANGNLVAHGLRAVNRVN